MSVGLSNAQMAWRAAQDIGSGDYVNLGIGLPELVARFGTGGDAPIYHTENGILGFGGPPAVGDEDWDLVNAGKKAVTLNPGASFFHQADSFAIVRGGHLDCALLGAYEVAETGDLANWSTGPGGVPAVGGAMDLVHGAKRVAVIMRHQARGGEPKLVSRCSLPLTGLGCVDRIYTDLAVVDVTTQGFVLREKLPTLSVEEVQERTGATLHIEGDVHDLVAPVLL